MAKIKGFFQKIGKWFVSHRPTKRKLIQLYAALLTNANVKGFVNGRIYEGNTKNLCVPGLNCYSCPGAIGACPIGALQDALSASGTRAPAYVFGIIILFGLILGRTICGWLCPFGFIQELLYKIKTPKVKKSRITRVLSYLKYVILCILIAIPVIYAGIPSFCKYICPAGTLEGAIGLILGDSTVFSYSGLGFLFTWKFCVLVAVVVGCIFVFRLFCRFICPLGALYGFFCKLALIGVKLDRSKCVDCGKCLQTCKMDIKHVGDHECIHCGECVSVCPTKAISWKGSKLFVHATSAEQVLEPKEPVKPLGSLLAKNAATGEAAVVGESVAPLRVVEVPVDTQEAVLEQDNNSETQTAETGNEKPKRKHSKAWWVRMIAWGLALIVLVGAWIYYNAIDKTGTSNGITVYEVGDDCPDFTLSVYQSASDKTQLSVSECKGKVTVINFWYTTCDPCVAELPEFEDVFEEYGDEINMFAVHAVKRTENVQKFLEKQTDSSDRVWSTYKIAFAQDTADVNAYTMLGGEGAYPITIILDVNGKITNIEKRALPKETLKQYIDEAIASTK